MITGWVILFLKVHNDSDSLYLRLYEIDIGLIVGCMPILPLITKHSTRLKNFVLMIRSLFSNVTNRHRPSHDWARTASYSSDAHSHGSFPNEELKTPAVVHISHRDRHNSTDLLSLMGADSPRNRGES